MKQKEGLLPKIKKLKIGWLVGFFCLYAGVAQAQTVSGVVIDEDTGEKLPGVNIVIQGTTTGTATDADGEFQLNVSSLNETLVLSYVGYETKEVAINGRETLELTLVSQAVLADELMVVAYGVQRKSDITGSISSASAEEFNQGVVVNPGQLLQGVVSGVNVTNASGEPGAAQDVIIRGVGSLRSGTTPLYVVDGFVLDNSSIGVANNPLNFLNPSDIESIEVLKDASATAIYGARAANGVIVITTKRGRSGQLRINYNANFSVKLRPTYNQFDLLKVR